MRFIYDDGGREAAGFKGAAGDCATRSIAIATGRPYREVYDAINELAQRERTGRRKRRRSSARNGVYTQTAKRYMDTLGWRWVPTMQIGSGCRVHLADGELPPGRIVARVSKHYTAVIDGVIHDTHDPQGDFYEHQPDGTTRKIERCVYGYWCQP